MYMPLSSAAQSNFSPASASNRFPSIVKFTFGIFCILCIPTSKFLIFCSHFDIRHFDIRHFDIRQSSFVNLFYLPASPVWLSEAMKSATLFQLRRNSPGMRQRNCCI